MRQFLLAFACEGIATLFLAGCASVNSTDYYDRMDAVRKIATEEDLMVAYDETKY